MTAITTTIAKTGRTGASQVAKGIARGILATGKNAGPKMNRPKPSSFLAKLPALLLKLWLLSGFFHFQSFTLQAQLKLVPDSAIQKVFAGTNRPVTTVWTNSVTKPVNTVLRTRLYQTSSATAALLHEAPWKALQVLPGQTVLESAAMDFPLIKHETRFVIQWIDDSKAIVGKTEVLVYPQDLLAALKPLLNEATLGILDPGNQLKPLLEKIGQPATDLSEQSLEDFHGALAIIGPFDSRTELAEGLPERIRQLARQGVAVVFLQPPLERGTAITPSFYSVHTDNRAVVIARNEMTANLASNPQSQLNLIHFCQLALHPKSPSIPEKL